ncbi:MAG: hypothetical protein KJZ65_05700 [Phycisphaerales bacterium]|nr:hypothetical protein [Phycisphaerales bacterium]
MVYHRGLARLSAVNLLDVIYGLVVAGTAPWWARKKRQGWRERFGHVELLPVSQERPRVLVHAVSVGEVSALRPLVPMLLDKYDVVISVSTDTGIARARELFGSTCRVVRFPLDFSCSVERFLDAVRPHAVAMVELEVWPNFVAACARRRIPVGVINGRLSAKSFRGYRRVRPLLRQTFGRLSLVGAQDEAYRERFVAMGVPGERCRVTGSMKWDAVDLGKVSRGPGERARAIGEEMGIDRGRLLIVAGSTAEGEEQLVHQACPPGVQLLCAPRHPQRFEEAAAALPGCVRRSSGRRGEGAERFVLDTIGELSAVYELADVVVIGRTFTPLRGSDPTEPVGLGKPTVVGPSMENFESIAATLEASGGIMRTTAAELAGVLRRLVEDRDEREALAKRGVECVRREQGATRRTLDLVGELVGRRIEWGS